MAALAAGIPNTAAVNTVNRQCSSGLTSVNQIANQITLGQIDIGIGTPPFPLLAARIPRSPPAQAPAWSR